MLKKEWSNKVCKLKRKFLLLFTVTLLDVFIKFVEDLTEKFFIAFERKCNIL